MTMFNFAEFLANPAERYRHSINRLEQSEYVYGADQWNHEYLDKFKQLYLKLSPKSGAVYHIQAPVPVPNQKYGWNSPMYIVEDETRC